MKKGIEDKIYSTFASIASSIGYSEVHGKIIAALLVSNRPLSLNEIAKKTQYSLAAISISLDLLEIVGMVKKIKNPRDRKVYARLEGDIIGGLKNAMLFKIQKEIYVTLGELEKYKKQDRSRDSRLAIGKIEKEVKRLDKYIGTLASVKVPK
ncbi:MAG: hypothetical protein V1870_00465 [Candidatus Aenigmatarchaeota archaeon]